MKSYKVKSIFKTLQGEGHFAGRPAVFLRFVGCNLWSGEEKTRVKDAEKNYASCPIFCDTDFRSEGSKSFHLVALIEEINNIAGPIRFCVITGGEPFLQADAALIRSLHNSGFYVSIETNGTKSISDAFSDEQGCSPPDWIVCSPKTKDPVIEYIHELKVVVPKYSPSNYDFLVRKIKLTSEGGPYLWAQPEDGKHLKDSIQQAIDFCLENPQWRVSVQTHKVLGIE